MAKGNALLGTLRGSIGDVTFSRVNGKQVSRAKATTVKNPRTSKQVYQRMFFATIGKAKAALKAIVDHSFENIQRGNVSLNYFQSRNVEIMRGNVRLIPELGIYASEGSYITPKWPYAVANTYRMSEGSIPTVRQLKALLNAPEGIPAGATIQDLDVVRKCVPLFNVQNLVSMTAQTLVPYQEAILKAEGLRPGDFMTYCFMSRKWADPVTGDNPVVENFHFIRLMAAEVSFAANAQPSFMALFVSNIDGQQYYVPKYITITPDGPATVQMLANAKAACFAILSHIETENNVFLPLLNVNHLNSFNFNYKEFYKQQVDIDRVLSDGEGITAGCWIHSRPAENGKLILSTQDMLLTDPTGDVYDYNLGIRDAYDAWNQGGTVIGDTTYILEGGNK